MSKQADETLCPLCHLDNFCGVNDPNGCWCMKEKVPTALIDKVPSHLKRQSCICQACIKKYQFDLAKQVE